MTHKRRLIPLPERQIIWGIISLYQNFAPPPALLSGSAPHAQAPTPKNEHRAHEIMSWVLRSLTDTDPTLIMRVVETLEQEGSLVRDNDLESLRYRLTRNGGTKYIEMDVDKGLGPDGRPINYF